MQFFHDFILHWPVITTLAAREIRSQYIGSFLGFFWQFLNPMVLILVFWVVFSIGFRVQPTQGVPFIVWLTAGIAAWFAFAEIVSGSVSCITSNPHLVKKMVFPTQVLPFVKVLTGFSNHLFFVLILLILIVAQGLPFSIFFLQGIYYFFCMVVLALGVGWIVAAFNVFTRDTERVVGLMLQVGMWATPVLWDIKIMPEPYRSILTLNPMHYVVQGYRDSFIYFIPLNERGHDSLVFWLVTLSLLVLGVFIFSRLRPQFSDLV